MYRKILQTLKTLNKEEGIIKNTKIWNSAIVLKKSTLVVISRMEIEGILEKFPPLVRLANWPLGAFGFNSETQLICCPEWKHEKEYDYHKKKLNNDKKVR